MFTPSMTNSSVQETQWIDRVEKLFLRFGVKSITMDDVAADLGISKKTLYQNVESKDALVLKVLEHHISREKSSCLQTISATPNAIEEIFLIMDRNTQELAQIKTNVVHDLRKYHKDAWDLVQKFQFDFVYKVIRDNMIRGRKEGLYRDDFDVDIIARLHLATAFILFDNDYFPEELTSKVNLFREFMMHNLHGILSAEGLIYLKKKLS
jgi:TetR/AcrR family transcriptional regulator, cholesterol catabolism regulator